MSFSEFISYLGFHSEWGFWGVIIFAMSIGIEIIPKIKWNPWSSLFEWVGSKFNSKINSNIDAKMKDFSNQIDMIEIKVDRIEHNVTNVSNNLTAHIKESENKSLQDIRRDILDFCNACMNKHRHTKEQFDFVIKQCDDYEEYIRVNKVKNGVIEAAIREIRRLYDKCIQDNDFLKEGEE